MKKTLAALLVAMFIPAVAAAQSSSKDDCAKQRGNKQKLCQLEFAAEELEGDVLTPNVTPISGKGQVKHPSLIRYRKHFFPQIVASADDRE